MAERKSFNAQAGETAVSNSLADVALSSRVKEPAAAESHMHEKCVYRDA